MKKKKRKPKKVGDIFSRAKKVKGGSVIEFLQKSEYKGCPVYIRMVEGKIFEYFIIYKNDLYTGYNIITPKKGKKKLTKREIAKCGALIFTGAITTVDILLDRDKPLAKNGKKKVH